MASVTTPPSAERAVVAPSPDTLSPPATVPVTVHIAPPRRLRELRLHELWEYRELLYFFVWRDVKARYKQTVIGVAWVILQPLLSMGVFTLFFGRLAKLAADGLPYPL